MNRILISGPDFCAVAEDGILTEYLERDPEQQYGDILGGTVDRMMPGIGSAFVDIGRKKSGFLPIRENSRSFTGPELRSGMKEAVQIRREETGNKGAFLTRDLTLAGKYILLMPLNRYIGISSRIREETERNRLRSLGAELARGETGLVLRTASQNAEKAEISAEVQSLTAEWHHIRQRIREGFSNGTVLYHQDPISQMIQDYESKGINERIESAALNADLQRQLQMSGNRSVPIRNGGNIVIDPCEAMTVIDVNSGSAKADSRENSAYLQTNLSACETIAAQIRLRNLSGIILIDFIDMNTDNDRAEVIRALSEMLERDRRKTVIHGWTSLGILEMTRKRTGTSRR